MLNRLRDLFSAKVEAQEGSHAERLGLATCVILLEAAKADEEFTAEERDRIIAGLRRRFSLSQTEAEELIEASEAARDQSYDLWRFTNRINQSCPPAEKIAIIEEVWRVIYADGTLEAHEDYLVHKLAKLLNLNHPQLIDAKLKVSRELRDPS